jgi:hypothetical protein
MILRVEMMFRSIDETTLLTQKNLKKTLVNQAKTLVHDTTLPICHNVKRKLLSKYFNVRLAIGSRIQPVVWRAELPRLALIFCRRANAKQR